MGTYMSDANAPNLLAGTTLNSATSSQGTPWQAEWPGFITFILTTGTVTGTTPTLNVTIEGDETADFSGTTTRILGRFGQVGDEDSVTHELTVYADAKYVRANITVAGTSPVFTGTTLTPNQPHFLRVLALGGTNGRGNSAGALS